MASNVNGQGHLSYDDVLASGKISVREWSRFARSMLKLSDHDIDIVQKDHERSVSDQRYAMVMLWDKRLSAAYDSKLSNEKPSPELLKQKMNEFHLTPEQLAASIPRSLPDSQKGLEHCSHSAPSSDVEARPAIAEGDAVDGQAKSTKTWTFGDKGIVQELVELSQLRMNANNQTPTCDEDDEDRGLKKLLKKIAKKKPTNSNYVPDDAMDSVPEGLSQLLIYDNDDVVVVPTSKENYQRLCKDPNVYPIVHKPYKGCVLILNNFTFKTLSYIKSGKREGKLLKTLFEGLGCKVDSRENKTAEEMKRILTAFLYGVEVPSQFDFCVVFILSHGEQRNGVDGYFGSDDVHVPVKDVVDELKAKESLSNTPKLLFLEICRTKRDNEETRQPQPDIGFTPKEVLKRIFPDKPPQQRAATFEGDVEMRRNKTDHLIVIFSTKEGTLAYTTHFTNATINIFSKEAKERTLHQLLNKVKLVLEESRTDQMADYKEEMNKDFYFFPGFPE